MRSSKLLTREEFREKVIARDGGICAVPGCEEPAADAHHILERKLWTKDQEGGYFLCNGVSLCERHHLHAEQGHIPPVALRMMAGITKVLPKDMEQEQDYDKWGKPYKMPLRERVKYPSTPYLDISPSQDCELILPVRAFVGVPIVVTVKMDGSNVVLTEEKMAARNGKTASHPSFSMLKARHYELAKGTPAGIQVFGEWLYAKHSIHYTGKMALSNLLQVFAAYDWKRRCWMPWGGVKKVAESMGVPTAPILGEMCLASEGKLAALLAGMAAKVIDQGHEGIVVRNVYPFHYGQFARYVAKYVRPNHVQTDDHWSRQKMVPNEVIR